MDKAIVVTTIHPPSKELKDFSKLKDWRLICAGDTKTPADWEIQGVNYLSPKIQNKLFTQFSKILPWRSYSRKNLAYLYAIKSGAKILAEIDDDVAPYKNYPPDLSKEKTLPVLSGPRFVNIYSIFGAHDSWPRGFPIANLRTTENIKKKKKKVFAPVQNSLLDQDGDFDAIYRLTSNKKVRYRKSGEFALDKGVYCPFHSGNTFWHPEAYPLLYIPAFINPHVEDIWRGYIAQRLLWEINGNLVFTYPTAYTDNRNPHNLIKDFEYELPLFLQTNLLIKTLDSLTLSKDLGKSLVKTYKALVKVGIAQKEEVRVVQAWLNELEKVQELR